MKWIPRILSLCAAMLALAQAAGAQDLPAFNAPALPRVLLDAMRAEIRRERAASTPAEEPSDPVLEAYIEVLLKDPSSDARIRATHLIAAMGAKPRAATSALCDRAANDTHARVRASSIWALGEIGAREAAPVVAKSLLQDNDITARVTAAVVLGKIGSADAAVPRALAIAQAHDDESYVRMLAGRSLAALRSGK